MEQNTNTQNFCIDDPVEVKNENYSSCGIIQNIDPHLQECKVNCMDGKIGWFKFSELTPMKDPEVEVECENCEDGIVEGEMNCSRAASNCCGGCAGNPEACDECNGTGMKYECISEIIDKIFNFTS